MVWVSWLRLSKYSLNETPETAFSCAVILGYITLNVSITEGPYYKNWPRYFCVRNGAYGMMRVTMSEQTNGRTLVDGRTTESSGISRWLSRAGLMLLVGLGATCGLLWQGAHAPRAEAAGCGGMWNPGVVEQDLTDSTNDMATFFNAFASKYGVPQVLGNTDSYYKDNTNPSGYIYPNNLGTYIPTVEPGGAVTDAEARSANGCITGAFATSHNLPTAWSTLANTGTVAGTNTKNYQYLQKFRLNNEVYCKTSTCPTPPTAGYNWRKGKSAKAFEDMYNLAIYRAGDGDKRGRAEGLTEPTDAFHIWTSPTNPATGNEMDFATFNAMQGSKNSNGTMVIRKNFSLTADDYDLYTSTLNKGPADPTKGALRIQGVADDFVGIWINGRPIVMTPQDGSAFMATINPDFLNAPATPGADSNNTLKIVLFSKHVLNKDLASYRDPSHRYMNSGLLYSIMYFPPPPASTAIYCRNPAVPGTVAVGEPFKFSVAAAISPIYGGISPSTNPKITFNLAGQSGALSYTYANSPATNTTVITSDDKSLTINSAGEYELSWTVQLSDGTRKTCASSTKLLVGRQPYFQITGGDVWSGTNGGSEGTGDIISWNADAAPYKGGNSQVAALATGNIQHFISGKGLDTPLASSRGYGLSLANTGSGVQATGTGEYGGQFRSLPDEAAKPTGVGCPDSDSAPLFSCDDSTGSLHIGGVVPANMTIVLVPGDIDLYIDSDLTYQYDTVAQIPHLYAYGKNIYVNPSVTEMHGTFGADDGFYSCGLYTYKDNPPDTGSCNAPLRIFGAVSAKSAYLTRTAGNWVDGTQAAEEFIYSPELWLNNASEIKPTSYVGLAPIL